MLLIKLIDFARNLKICYKLYMKKVLVSGYIGFGNFGDEAIFYALSQHLKALNFDVSVLCKNRKNVQDKYDVCAYDYMNIFQIFFALLRCDILISGGGSLLQNKTSNFSLFYYLFIIFLAKMFNKKVIIFAQGFEPIIGKMPEIILKKVLKLCDFISVRDENSVNYLNTLKINSALVSDPVYSLIQDKEINKNKDGLIVQLRDFRGMDLKLISNLAKNISRNYKGKIGVFSFQDEYDKKICLDFIEELKNNNLEAELIKDKTIAETIEILNCAKYVISTRLHGLIVSNALCANTFAICYDEKIKTLAKELNLKNIDILSYEQGELDNKLDEFFNHCLNEVHPYRRFEWKKIDTELKN